MDQRLAQIMRRPARPSSHRAYGAECITRERAHSRAYAWTRAGTPLPSPWDLRSAARVRRSQESGAVAAAAAPFKAAAAKLRPGPGPARARARAGLSVWVLATHLGAVAPTYHALLVARVLSGVGEASFQAGPPAPPPPPPRPSITSPPPLPSSTTSPLPSPPCRLAQPVPAPLSCGPLPRATRRAWQAGVSPGPCPEGGSARGQRRRNATPSLSSSITLPSRASEGRLVADEDERGREGERRQEGGEGACVWGGKL